VVGEEKEGVVSARTFSVQVRPTTERMKSAFGDVTVTVVADPVEEKQDNGTTRVSMGFPVLHVSGWVGEPEAFAKRVAELLTAQQP
jgi:hypothetical protein